MNGNRVRFSARIECTVTVIRHRNPCHRNSNPQQSAVHTITVIPDAYEIEITPEMIKVGVCALLRLEDETLGAPSSFSLERLVIGVFGEMAAATGPRHIEAHQK